MSTRSMIGKLNEDGSVTAIYCHFDGYPSHNGKILNEHYTDEKKVDELLALGSLSILAANVHPDPEVEHKFGGNVQEGVCLAYHRDRGEDWNQADYVNEKQFRQNAGNDCWANYTYLFKDNAWSCWRA